MRQITYFQVAEFELGMITLGVVGIALTFLAAGLMIGLTLSLNSWEFAIPTGALILAGTWQLYEHERFIRHIKKEHSFTNQEDGERG